MTKPEAAHRLRVSERTIERMAADGRLPVIRLSAGTVRYSTTDLDQLAHSA